MKQIAPYSFFYVAALMLCGFIMHSGAAHAQTLHMTAKHWRVFTLKQSGETMCYIASLPTGKKGNYKKRDDPFVIVTHRDKNTDEVSVSSGYPYFKEKDVKVRIDRTNYQLFSQGDRGWAKDEATDASMVKRMKIGSKMVVYGRSQLNTTSEDSYSLSGFTAAYRKMKELCR